MKYSKYAIKGFLTVMAQVLAFAPLLIMGGLQFKSLFTNNLSLVFYTLVYLLGLGVLGYAVIAKSMKWNLVALILVLAFNVYLFYENSILIDYRLLIVLNTVYYGFVFAVSRLSYLIKVPEENLSL